MMRLLLVLGCALVLLAPSARAAPSTSLTITYVEDSARPDDRVRWTLRCDPAGGTHPRPVAACRELARAGWQAFLPPPPDMACAEIYGGPQLAIVTGRVDGRRVWARLTRTDGCQIARWKRLPALLPPGGVS
jgi:Subtilisin inhibitor-like